MDLLVSMLHFFLVVLYFFCLSVNIIALLLSQPNCFLQIRFNIIFSFSFDLFPYQTPAVASFVLEATFFYELDVAYVEFGAVAN